MSVPLVVSLPPVTDTPGLRRYRAPSSLAFLNRPDVRAEGGRERRTAGGAAEAMAGAGEGDGGRQERAEVGGGPGAESRLCRSSPEGDNVLISPQLCTST